MTYVPDTDELRAEAAADLDDARRLLIAAARKLDFAGLGRAHSHLMGSLARLDDGLSLLTEHGDE